MVTRRLIFLLVLAFGCSRKPKLLEYAPQGKDSVLQLLNAGADPNTSDESKTTALHVAAMNGDSEVAHVLLAHGAKVDARTTAEETPLFMAARRGSPDTVFELLVAGADPDAMSGEIGYTPLHAAAFWGTPETVSVLLRGGANLNAKTGAWETALHLAARVLDPMRALGTCEVLLAAGADARAPDLRGFAVGHTAASADNLDVIKALQQHGVDLDAVAIDGTNATDVAIRYESDRVAQFLFESGIAPRLNPTAEPPIVIATRMGDTLRVRKILSSATGESMGRARALEIATQNRREDLMTLLAENTRKR